ncbi:hypothetical protein RO21_06035 [[Actinobacillus] muris]|uniref:DUF2681 domain-containing protein n=1 Tax=Muribacter muris TaxID=67855 RepID=A0A0J5P5D5_9PAST|nr:DUF2681 domain-containing protein [Muribacter muris]KMK51471.1 hypothetical protein RO21_06035 [[Actinobacillus] muris] [Muribacter muris]
MIIAQIIITAVFALCIVGWCLWQSRKANALAKKLAEQTAYNQQLQTEKAVVETQLKHHEVRKQNEENVISLDRKRIIDRLHTNADLRD